MEIVDENDLMVMLDNIEKDLCHQYSPACKFVFIIYFLFFYFVISLLFSSWIVVMV